MLLHVLLYDYVLCVDVLCMDLLDHVIMHDKWNVSVKRICTLHTQIYELVVPEEGLSYSSG